VSVLHLTTDQLDVDCCLCDNIVSWCHNIVPGVVLQTSHETCVISVELSHSSMTRLLYLSYLLNGWVE